MDPGIVLHLNADGMANWRTASRFELYKKLVDLAEASGDTIELRRSERITGDTVSAPGDRRLHFVHGGSINGVGWLNSSLSYLPGFWHIDPDGILANSSARNHCFDPSTVRRHVADSFAQGLRAKFSDRRRSRYDQSVLSDTVPNQCVAVFLQGRHPYANRQSFMPMVEMIKEVLAGSGSFPVLVKPHPLERDIGLDAISQIAEADRYLCVSNANVHDILRQAVAVVSVNSSVTFEGFMHEKPSIVFGRTDHPSLVETVRKRGEFSIKLRSALDRDWDYAGMLHWYFKNHSVRLRSKRFLSTLYQAVRKSGRDPTDYKIFQSLKLSSSQEPYAAK